MQVELGNRFKKFGSKLPTPYIEQVRIYDDHQIIRVVLYFEIPFDLDPEEYFELIASDLGNVIVFQIVDGYVPSTSYGLLPHSGTISSGRTNMASNILSNKYSVLEMWTNNEATFQFAEESDDDSEELQFVYNAGSSAIKIPVTDFNFSTFSEAGQTKVCKFVHEKSINFLVEAGLGDTITFSQLQDYALDYNLFCSLIPSDTVDLDSATYTEMFWTGESGGSSGARMTTGLYTLAKASMSDLTSQNILQTGSLSTSPVEVYIDPSNSVWSGEIVQALNGTYHTDEESTLQQISTSISNLLLSSSNEEVKSGVNSISYIISKYGSSAELLPQLYSFYKVAPYKGAPTEAGSWFEGVSSQMFRLNEAVTTARILKKELAFTPTIVDLRTIVLDQYEPPTPSDYIVETDFIYGAPWNSLMHRSGYYGADRALGTSQQFSSTEDFTTFTKGFFFFDYEKALKTQSQISLMLDIDKLILAFDAGITNQKFRLKSAKAERYYNSTGTNDSEVLSDAIYLDMSNYSFQMSTQVTYDLENDYSYPEILTMQYQGGTDTTFKSSYNFADYTAEESESIYYPYIYLRNWDLVSAAGLGDYRLMCFEYQQINTTNGGYYENERNKDFTVFRVTIEDTTAQLYQTLVDGFANVLTGSLTEYAAYANEFCSYNNLDNYFNEFFVDTITNTYDDDTSKPWFLAPLVYNFHLDLLTNQWAGDQSTIISEAREMSARINPVGGTVDEINSFLELMTNLYNTYYAPGEGTLALIYEGLAESNTLTFGGDSSGGAQNGYAPLPAVDFLNLIAYVPETEDVWIFDKMGSYALQYGKYWQDRDLDEFNKGISFEFSWPGDYGAADIVREGISEWVDSDDRVKNVRKGMEDSTGNTVTKTYETYFVPVVNSAASSTITLQSYTSGPAAQSAIEGSGTELSTIDGGNDYFVVRLYLSDPGDKSTGTVSVGWYRGQSYTQELPDPADED